MEEATLTAGAADLFDQQNEKHQEREPEDEVCQVSEIYEGKVRSLHPNGLRYGDDRHLVASFLDVIPGRHSGT